MRCTARQVRTKGAVYSLEAFEDSNVLLAGVNNKLQVYQWENLSVAASKGSHLANHQFFCHRVDTGISHSDRRPTKFCLSGLIVRSEHCGHILVLYIVRHVLYRPYRWDSCHGCTRRRHVATSYWLATS